MFPIIIEKMKFLYNSIYLQITLGKIIVLQLLKLGGKQYNMRQSNLEDFSTNATEHGLKIELFFQ